MDAIQTYQGLIDSLMRAYLPDMTRSDERTDTRRACYSETRLVEMLGTADARMLVRAFEGVPMFADQVRYYLYGLVSGRITAERL